MFVNEVVVSADHSATICSSVNLAIFISVLVKLRKTQPITGPMSGVHSNGKQHYLWRAVDQDREVVDVFLQDRRDSRSAKCFFKRLLKAHQNEPRTIVTDKLRSYGVAHRELIPGTIHDTSQYANNRAELSHQPTWVRERRMRHFKSIRQAQRFLTAHAAVHNLFNLSRHIISAKTYRFFPLRAFAR